MKRCMFVDDSAVIRKVAKRILGGPELVIIEASTGFEAVSICAADMPDIIVVDSALPDMTAVDFIRRVRAIETPVQPQIAICLTDVQIIPATTPPPGKSGNSPCNERASAGSESFNCGCKE